MVDGQASLLCPSTSSCMPCHLQMQVVSCRKKVLVEKSNNAMYMHRVIEHTSGHVLAAEGASDCGRTQISVT